MLRFIILGLLIITGLTACSSNDVVSYRSGEMTHAFAKNKRLISQKLPVPIYPNAKITGFVENEDKDEANYLIAQTSDPLAKVIEFYNNSLTSNNWSIENNTNIDQITSISCHKSDMDANIMLSYANGLTYINISYYSINSIKSKPDTRKDSENPLDSTD